MNDNEIFRALFGGGRFSLPYLVLFSFPGLEPIALVNSDRDLMFDGITYKSATLKYHEPDMMGNGGSLSVAMQGTRLVEFLDTADWRMTVDVTGVINFDGTVSRLGCFRHMNCEASWGSNMELSLQLNPDDRLGMTFPPYLFDADNNRGGA